MNLWLDDERDPTTPFIQTHFGAKGDEVWVKTAEEAIEYLKSGKVESISFDHDLGTERTGYDVAKFIEQEAHFKRLPRLNWKIHSANSVGAKNILAAMLSSDKKWDAA